MTGVLWRRLVTGAGRVAPVPASEDRSLMARVGVYLFVSGSFVGLLSLMLPGGHDRDETAIFAIAVTAFLLGIVELIGFDRLPRVAFSVLTGCGTALVSATLLFGGESAGFYKLFYFWVVLYASYFLPLRQAALHVGLVALGYAIALNFQNVEGLSLLAWFLTVTTLSVVGALVIALKRRLEGLVAQEHEQVTRLRDLDRMKDEFIATVSHELRTPLASVYGAALTLRRHGLDPKRRDALLGLVYRESERLARLVEDVLWASRLGDGQEAIASGPCQAEEVALEVVESARAREPEALALELITSGEPVSVAVDPEKFRHILTNLVENAVKYSPAGSRIEVRLGCSNGRLELAVRDEGIGIPGDEQERIFEKFYRLDPHHIRGVGGTGLGLYICRALVEQMHGSIRVESVLGAGSTFMVELPLAEPLHHEFPRSPDG